MKKLRVIDFFCGAGGFSEGFRQAGFEVIKGIDNWTPAIITHNINHGLNDESMSVLEFEDIDAINQLPDSEVIVGSPPCVSFSLSNKGGNADKALGIRLIESYLRVVAVKKHQPNSVLKAWLMENVPNSKNYVKAKYTFVDLNLEDWANNLGIKPDSVALNASIEGEVLVASDYGTAQARSRFVCGEIIETDKFPSLVRADKHLRVKDIRKALPAPLTRIKKDNTIVDPNYSNVLIATNQLSDHYYDTGVYEVEWQKAKSHKINHPYMGRMSFPENEDKPSRTIMATRSASTREAVLYRSEFKRVGDGEYRLPTVREAATIMGFPLTYVFYGNEANKWRQIGNAVCPQMAFALANSIRQSLKLSYVKKPRVKHETIADETIVYLDDFKMNDFSKPPKKSKNALFRAHPVKSGNMTVSLTNKNPANGIGDWGVYAFMGTGKTYRFVAITEVHKKEAELILKLHAPDFIKIVKADKSMSYLDNKALDYLNESYHYKDKSGEHPLSIVNKIGEYITETTSELGDQILKTNGYTLTALKEAVPLSQVMAIYSIGSIVHLSKSQ